METLWFATQMTHSTTSLGASAVALLKMGMTVAGPRLWRLWFEKILAQHHDGSPGNSWRDPHTGYDRHHHRQQLSHLHRQRLGRKACVVSSLRRARSHHWSCVLWNFVWRGPTVLTYFWDIVFDCKLQIKMFTVHTSYHIFLATQWT